MRWLLLSSFPRLIRNLGLRDLLLFGGVWECLWASCTSPYTMRLPTSRLPASSWILCFTFRGCGVHSWRSGDLLWARVSTWQTKFQRCGNAFWTNSVLRWARLLCSIALSHDGLPGVASAWLSIRFGLARFASHTNLSCIRICLISPSIRERVMRFLGKYYHTAMCLPWQWLLLVLQENQLGIDSWNCYESIHWMHELNDYATKDS